LCASSRLTGLERSLRMAHLAGLLVDMELHDSGGDKLGFAM
jgi:hypothetical protein